MKVDNIYKLIEVVSKLNISKFDYEEDGKRISLTFNSNYKQASNITFEPVLEKETTEEKVTEEPSGNVIKSPIVGTFYVSGEEGGEPFVNIGDNIKKGDVVAIVEAMKLMNEIQSEYDGVVKKVFVDNGDTVEFGQPMFEIE